MARFWRGMFRSQITLVERGLPYCNLDGLRVIVFVAFGDNVSVVGLGGDGVGAFAHTSGVPIKGGGDGEAIADWRNVNLNERGRVLVEGQTSLRPSRVCLTLLRNR